MNRREAAKKIVAGAVGFPLLAALAPRPAEAAPDSSGYDDMGRPWHLKAEEHPSLADMVYVDGREVETTMEAHRLEGWVIALDIPASNRINDLVTYKVRGRVTVRWCDGRLPEIS